MGVRSVKQIVENCAKRGIEALTLFAFSSENWKRPKEEVSMLMGRFLEALDNEVDKLHENGIRLRFIGAQDQLSEPLRRRMEAAAQLTANNQRMTLVVAVAYGGRWDLCQATKAVAKECLAGNLKVDDIGDETIARHLALADLPDPDLLIRTGGEQRISNFLLWDIAYAEVYFTASLWPDFTAAELEHAFEFYAERQRRFGRTGEQVEAIGC